MAAFAAALGLLVVALAIGSRDDGAFAAPVGTTPNPSNEAPPGFFQIVSRDTIRPLYEPSFVAADTVDWPDDTDVIGVRLGGESKAYPISQLNGFEMVVDELGDRPILVTWCPICGTALVHDRRVDGEEVVFGNQGALWMHAMTWWDHDTGSIWSQPLGEAIAGPLEGATLELLPSEFTTWGAWRDAHPDGLALDSPGVPTGYALDQMFVVVDFGSDVHAYPIVDLRTEGAVNDVVAGVELAVVSDPTDEDRWAVWSRHVAGRLVDLEVDGDTLRDRTTGTTFHPVLGIGLEGPLAEFRLDRLPALTSRPGGGPTKIEVLRSFWPDAEVWTPDE